jgi:hypothetical protein
MPSYTPPSIPLTLQPSEAEEILNFTESILRENAPDEIAHLQGPELVARVLHYADPENFRERNAQRIEMVEDLLNLKSPEPSLCVGTYHEAEIEYEYLHRISGIYLKLHQALTARL